MNQLLSAMEKKRTLRKITTSPSVYSVVLDIKGRKFLHSGVHTSLEEAVAKGKDIAYSRIGTTPAKADASLIVWSILDGKEALDGLTESEKIVVGERLPSVLFSLDECKKSISNAQSVMMQLIMKDGNSEILEENKPFLSKSAYRYVKDHLEEVTV